MIELVIVTNMVSIVVTAAIVYAVMERRPQRIEPAQTLDRHVQSVIAQIQQRAHQGRRKYGTDMEREDLTTAQWLQHAQEEALDLAVYLQRLRADQETAPTVKRRYRI